MRLPRPSRVDNIETDRLVAAIDYLTDRIATYDQPRGQMIRDGARRVIMQDALARRGVKVRMTGNPDACRALFGIPPVVGTSTSPQPERNTPQ